MPGPISLSIIGGSECIGDSLPKINNNAVTIASSINELYTLYNTINAGIPTVQTFQYYQTELQKIEEKVDHIQGDQAEIYNEWASGLLAADFLTPPYSLMLSAMITTLSAFKIQPNPATNINDQTLLYDLNTAAWTPISIASAIQPTTNPNGYRISTWNTTTSTFAKITSSNYVSLPGGLIMQFGRLSAAAGDGVLGRSPNREIYVQFPLPFPNDVLNITTNTVVSGIDLGVSAQSYIKQGFNKNGFTIVKNLSGNGNIFEMWSAIGF